MADILVVADDMTGANATAAGFARTGRRAVTVGLDRQAEAIAEFYPRFDVVVATTDSRHSDPAVAAERTVQAVRAGWPVQMLTCRIDSTLRGNVGVSAEALIQTAKELSNRRVMGLCIPAHPMADRTAIEGMILLNGSRLEHTELANDVRSPVSTSSIADALQNNSELSTTLIPLSVVTSGPNQLRNELLKAVESGVDVVIADSLSLDHLDKVSQAAGAVSEIHPDILWVGIDPGPGSVAMANALLKGTMTSSRPPLFAVSGSATALTRTQLAKLIDAKDVVIVRADATATPSGIDIDAVTAELDAAFANVLPGQIILLATVLAESDLRPLAPEQSHALPTALGRIVRRVLESHAVGGLYTTGGDITAAVIDALGGSGISITDEVVPLATAGEIVGGSFDGLPIVTKGGLVGGADTAIACLDTLARNAEARARWVPAAIPR